MLYSHLITNILNIFLAKNNTTAVASTSSTFSQTKNNNQCEIQLLLLMLLIIKYVIQFLLATINDSVVGVADKSTNVVQNTRILHSSSILSGINTQNATFINVMTSTDLQGILFLFKRKNM